MSFSVETASTVPDMYYLRVEVTNEDGIVHSEGVNFLAYGRLAPFFIENSLVISPNPTIGEATVTIKSTSNEKSFNENTLWDLEVYAQNQLLKSKVASIRGNSTVIQTSGWKEGVYIVRVIYNGDILIGKMIVKR